MTHNGVLKELRRLGGDLLGSHPFFFKGVAGGGYTLAWDVKGKSRELTERMEALLNAITRDSTTGDDIPKSELLENWQAVRAMGAEMREWMRLHGQATGELARDGLNTQTMSVQVLPGDRIESGDDAADHVRQYRSGRN